MAIAHGMELARDLGNLPGNICTPTYLGERALELAREFPDLKVQVLERAEIEALGMGSFLSVADGSAAAAALHRHGVPAIRRARREPVRARRQGHHVRHRRHLAQARAARWTT